MEVMQFILQEQIEDVPFAQLLQKADEATGACCEVCFDRNISTKRVLWHGAIGFRLPRLFKQMERSERCFSQLRRSGVKEFEVWQDEESREMVMNES